MILKEKAQTQYTNKFSPQTPERTGHGPAGGSGHRVCLGERPAQDPATILHPMGAEKPAWAPPLKLSTANTEQGAFLWMTV